MDKQVLRCNYLIKRIQNGDEKALDTLFVEFGRLFLNMAKIYLFDDRYAEDLLSEVFLDLIKNQAKSFDESKNGLNWLFVSIKRKAYRYNGKYSLDGNNVQDLDSQKSLIHFIDLADNLDRVIDKTVIADALKLLDDYENSLLYYKYWECLTVREIAAKLNKPKSTVHNEIKGILKKLKGIIGK